MLTNANESFVSFDGAKLAYRAWLPEAPATHAVLLFHRGHEHSGRWQSLVDGLVADGYAVFAWDQRGHGASDGERGTAPSFAAVVRDADGFAKHVAGTYGIPTSRTAVVATSLGAVVATAWVHDYGPPVTALVLAAPAFEVKLYVPLAVPSLRLKQAVWPGGFVKSFVKPRMLTGDVTEQKAYAADAKIFPQIAVDMLLDLHDAGRRIVDDAGAITTPTLVLTAGRDWVVRREPQRRFFQRLGSTVKRLEYFPTGRHALFHDTVSPSVIKATRRFVKDNLAGDSATDVTRSDLGGPSRTEYDLLRTPPSLPWKVARAVVRLGGWFSDGIKLGWSTGFDSGRTLDYVYANKPAGRTPIGRMVDKNYLNAIGWRGIRVRREHLGELLAEVVDRTTAAGRPVHVLDVAAGAGRYVLECLKPGMTAELRDYRQANLDAAADLAKSLGVSGVTFKLADAFDRASVALTSPRPAIAIVSGLYELFPSNDDVRRSLAGLADAVVDGGYLIYTCQPWHPQVEFIARTLVNREGQPWVMRRRSQAEMDALVRGAGFEKLDQRIDRWGIFTVGLARKR